MKLTQSAAIMVTATLSAASVCGPAAARQHGPASRPADQVLAALLERLPAENAREADAIGRELAALGEAGVRELCARVREPGRGDDRAERLALHALAFHAGGPDRDRERRELVRGLCDGLAAARADAHGAGPDACAFLIEQLRLAGGDDAVAALAACLSDESLHQPAADALVSIGTVKAAAALREALLRAVGPPRVAIITALGDLRDAQAAPLLLAAFQVGDAAAADAAFAALCRIGDERVFEAVVNPILGASWYNESRLTGLTLTLRRVQAAAGQRERAAQRLEKLFESALASPDEPHLATAALAGLLEARGASAVPQLLRAASADSLELRSAALELATRVRAPGLTEALVGSQTHLPPATRAALLEALGRRGDPAALAALLRALHDDEGSVRVAAIRATARLAGGQALDPLLARLGAGTRAEKDAALDGLAAIAGDDVTGRLLDALDSPDAALRASILAVLMRRPPSGNVTPILDALGDGVDEVRLAALRAAREWAGPSDAARLVRHLLERSADDAERDAASEALAAAVRRGGRDADLDPILAALPAADRESCGALLRALGRVGGPAALRTVTAHLADVRVGVRAAAVDALADWPDPGAVRFLRAVARESFELASADAHAPERPALRENARAIAGLARLVEADATRADADKLDRYREALAVALRVEEKRLLLSCLGRLRTPAALEALAEKLDDAALAAEAGAAVAALARSLAHDSCGAARAALEKTLAAAVPDAVRTAAREALTEVARYEDHVTDWRIAGPFLLAGLDGRALFDVPFPPESEDAGGNESEWRRLAPADAAGSCWRVDLGAALGGDHRAAYLRTRLWSPTEQPVRFELGSDDGVKLWVAGVLVHANNAARGCTPGADSVEAVLRQGWNEVLLKVTNGGGAWAACLRVRGRDGAALAGVRASAE